MTEKSQGLELSVDDLVNSPRNGPGARVGVDLQVGTGDRVKKEGSCGEALLC